jgi:hypothetical protein
MCLVGSMKHHRFYRTERLMKAKGLCKHRKISKSHDALKLGSLLLLLQVVVWEHNRSVQLTCPKSVGDALDEFWLLANYNFFSDVLQRLTAVALYDRLEYTQPTADPKGELCYLPDN